MVHLIPMANMFPIDVLPAVFRLYEPGARLGRTEGTEELGVIICHSSDGIATPPIFLSFFFRKKTTPETVGTG